ncbi:MAG TPA: hypothetical protein VGM37_11475 [Armatimonadota bacterium]|jgi:hypothetical protein
MEDPRIDNAVREFLGESAPASQLREWREALEHRLKMMRAEAAQDPESHESLRLKIQRLQDQIKVLAEEEAISDFVEDTVRSTLADVAAESPDAPNYDTDIPAWAALDIDDEPEE